VRARGEEDSRRRANLELCLRLGCSSTRVHQPAAHAAERALHHRTSAPAVEPPQHRRLIACRCCSYRRSAPALPRVCTPIGRRQLRPAVVCASIGYFPFRLVSLPPPLLSQIFEACTLLSAFPPASSTALLPSSSSASLLFLSFPSLPLFLSLFLPSLSYIMLLETNCCY